MHLPVLGTTLNGVLREISRAFLDPTSDHTAWLQQLKEEISLNEVVVLEAIRRCYQKAEPLDSDSVAFTQILQEVRLIVREYDGSGKPHGRLEDLSFCAVTFPDDLIQSFLQYFNRFVFLNVKPCGTGNVGDYDWRGCYSYLILHGINSAMGSSLERDDVELLLTHYQVSNLDELTAKIFFAPKKYSGSSVINYFLTQLRHDGQYVCPKEDQLYERAVSALARMECPDYTDIDDETVFQYFIQAFNGLSCDDSWLTKLQTDVYQRSDGKVVLEEADRETFSVGYKGPAEYLQLVGFGKTQLLIFGPYGTPFHFVEPKK